MGCIDESATVRVGCQEECEARAAAANSSFGQGQTPGNGEEVAQGVRTDLRQTDQDQGIGPVVVRQVVGFGGIFDEVPAFFPVGSDDERVRFGRGMGGESGEETAAQLQNGGSIVFRGGFDIRQREPNGANRLEGIDSPGSHRMHGTRMQIDGVTGQC